MDKDGRIQSLQQRLSDSVAAENELRQALTESNATNRNDHARIADLEEHCKALRMTCKSQEKLIFGAKAEIHALIDEIGVVSTEAQKLTVNLQNNALTSQTISDGLVRMQTTIRRVFNGLHKTSADLVQSEPLSEDSSFVRTDVHELERKLSKQSELIQLMEQREMDLGSSYNTLLSEYEKLYAHVSQLEGSSDSEHEFETMSFSGATSKIISPSLQTEAGSPRDNVMTGTEAHQFQLGRRPQASVHQKLVQIPEEANAYAQNEVAATNGQCKLTEPNDNDSTEQLAKRMRRLSGKGSQMATADQKRQISDLENFDQNMSVVRMHYETVPGCLPIGLLNGFERAASPTDRDSRSDQLAINTNPTFVPEPNPEQEKNLKFFSLLENCISVTDQQQLSLHDRLNLETHFTSHNIPKRTSPRSKDDLDTNLYEERENEIKKWLTNWEVFSNSNRLGSVRDQCKQLTESVVLQQSIISEQHALLCQRNLEAQKLMEEQQTSAKRSSELSLLIDQLAPEIDSLRKNVATSQKESDSLREHEAALRRECQVLKSVVLSQKQMEEKTNEKLNKLIAQKNEAEHQLQATSQSIRTKSEELRSAERSMKVCQQQIDEAKESLKRCENELDEMKSSLHVLVQTKDEIEVSLKTKADELQRSMTEGKARMREIRELGQRHCDLENTLSTLQTQCANLRLIRNIKEEKIEELKQKSEAQRQTKCDLERTNARLSNNITTAYYTATMSDNEFLATEQSPPTSDTTSRQLPTSKSTVTLNDSSSAGNHNGVERADRSQQRVGLITVVTETDSSQIKQPDGEQEQKQVETERQLSTIHELAAGLEKTKNHSESGVDSQERQSDRFSESWTAEEMQSALRQAMEDMDKLFV